jgi:RNA polymerase sigma factor (sigma-70 family)
MVHDTDLEDAHLLAAGDIAGLLAKYNEVIVARCVAKLRGSLDAEDVAQDVKLRLLAEFERGKRYGDVPYRVVVHQVIGWTIADYFDGRRTDVPLPEGWEPAVDDETASVDSRRYLMDLFHDLPDQTRRVLELRYVLGFEHDEIAGELQMTPNAVYQRLHKGHAKLRAVLTHG